MNTLTPFYDPDRSYEDNYDEGPFGAFAQVPTESLPKTKSVTFFGYPLDIPFGIPAGPLLNSKFIRAAWDWGFALTTYKTVRGTSYPCHPHPNVITVLSTSPNIHPGATVQGNLTTKSINVDTDGITNSFGVPSKNVAVWQQDATKALAGMQTGNLMIMSFMGTKQESMDLRAYVDDFAATCRHAAAIAPPVLEVNFSCPNVGKEGLICNDVATSRAILEALHEAKGNIPLLVKIGYFPPEQQDVLVQLLEAIYETADGVVAINTIQAKVVDASGKQILPGSPVRLQSGVCGAAIRWAGMEMAERIMAVKKAKGWKDFVAVGVGGVTRPEDYQRYMSFGVDAVQSATGAMWKPELAIHIRKTV